MGGRDGNGLWWDLPCPGVEFLGFPTSFGIVVFMVGFGLC